MARSYTEERVVKQLQRYIMYYISECNVSKEDFCSRVDIFETTYDELMDMNARGEVWSPRWVYRMWDTLNLATPGITVPDSWQ